MELSTLRSVYERQGPFVTVYFEGRSAGEDSKEQMRLRWRALRERLADEGAPIALLDAIESELGSDVPGEVQTNGRVLVATGPAVVLDEPWDAALGAGDDAHFGELPQLGAYAREAARSVRALVVIADQRGAQVRQEVVAEQHEPRETDAAVVKGGAVGGVHKPRGGALSHNRIQRRADEAVDRNAKDIVSHLRGVASDFRPRVLVLAGEVQARTAVRKELPDGLIERLVETDRGGRDEHASDEALADELLRVAGEESANRAEHYSERLRKGLAHDRAVEGRGAVAHAARVGAVDTLLFRHDTPAFREAALLRDCAVTGSAVALVADDAELSDGIGALLRFPLKD